MFKELKNARKKPITKAEGREERCDKKKDIKIPFSENERKLIKRLAKMDRMTPTSFCTSLIKKVLTTNNNYPIVHYDPKGKPYPVKLEKYYHDKIFDYTVEWDCSLKEAAYRIISLVLKERSKLNFYE